MIPERISARVILLGCAAGAPGASSRSLATWVGETAPGLRASQAGCAGDTRVTKATKGKPRHNLAWQVRLGPVRSIECGAAAWL